MLPSTVASVNKWSWQTCCSKSFRANVINYSVSHSFFDIRPKTKAKQQWIKIKKWMQTQPLIYSMSAWPAAVCISAHQGNLKRAKKTSGNMGEHQCCLEKLKWNLAVSLGSEINCCLQKPLIQIGLSHKSWDVLSSFFADLVQILWEWKKARGWLRTREQSGHADFPASHHV